MEQPTEPGFYWAKPDENWEPVRVTEYGGRLIALLHGSEPEFDMDTVEQWGPRIEPPGARSEFESVARMCKNLDETKRLLAATLDKIVKDPDDAPG